MLGLPPPEIEFPEGDTEEINVANLPSVYRSLWETGRKHDLDDATIERIIGMFAYDVDMNKRITAGDSHRNPRDGARCAGPQGSALCGADAGHDDPAALSLHHQRWRRRFLRSGRRDRQALPDPPAAAGRGHVAVALRLSRPSDLPYPQAAYRRRSGGVDRHADLCVGRRRDRICRMAIGLWQQDRDQARQRL